MNSVDQSGILERGENKKGRHPKAINISKRQEKESRDMGMLLRAAKRKKDEEKQEMAEVYIERDLDQEDDHNNYEEKEQGKYIINELVKAVKELIEESRTMGDKIKELKKELFEREEKYLK